MFKPYTLAQVEFTMCKDIGQEGKNSDVYTAHDKNLDAELVIKRIPKSGFIGSDQFFSESRILYLGRHSNVVPVHYACEDDEYIYIAMPYFPKGSLNNVLKQRHLTVREIIRYATQFLSGLHNIHSKGLIHFDIKPDNILLSDRNEALVSDFGLAKHMSLTGLAEQDRNYLKHLPPEVMDGDQFDKSFDIFQVGITLYRMCNGNDMFYKQFYSYGDQTSFDRHRFKVDVRNGQFPDRSCFNSHIPSKLRNTIKTCLSVTPGDRYKSAIEIVNALSEVDGCELDWQFTLNDNGSRSWHKICDQKEYCLSVDDNQQSIATKTVNGTERHMKSHCLNPISEKQIKEFLKAY